MTPRFDVHVEGDQALGSYDRMIVGEAPGRKELAQLAPRKPFVADAGDLLYATLWREAADRHSVYVTNAFKGDVFGRGGDPHPTEDELRDHFPLLEDEIRTVDPNIILALGGRATHVLLPSLVPKVNSPFLDYIGGVCRSPVVGIPVMVCCHPSFVLRGGSRGKRPRITRQDFAAIIRDFLSYRRGRLPPRVIELLKSDPWKDKCV